MLTQFELHSPVKGRAAVITDRSPPKEIMMIHLELTIEEGQHLKEEVTRRLTELDHEIAHTDALNFKDMLKRRRKAVCSFLEKLADVPLAVT